MCDVSGHMCFSMSHLCPRIIKDKTPFKTYCHLKLKHPIVLMGMAGKKMLHAHLWALLKGLPRSTATYDFNWSQSFTNPQRSQCTKMSHCLKWKTLKFQKRCKCAPYTHRHSVHNIYMHVPGSIWYGRVEAPLQHPPLPYSQVSPMLVRPNSQVFGSLCFHGSAWVCRVVGLCLCRYTSLCELQKWVIIMQNSWHSEGYCCEMKHCFH